MSTVGTPMHSFPYGSRLLVADDDDEFRDAVALVLHRAGAHVVEARDGLSALDLALSERFDLVLFDLELQNLDAPTLTAALRSRGVNAPIVAMSAVPRTGEEQLCRGEGFDGYMSKSVDVESMLSLLDAVHRRHSNEVLRQTWPGRG